ncbi:hypothetical protein ABI_24230 [Asticcacaulis biprosthecium C19]|uniref:Uncharacterized protein n=1 Tax=Asticcacaulis biprosthecium C19 TaxID=715226 RepID=F4QNV2_9CAUL|nr:hypothetical protein [Asticcacaulis biprosthecium]EGF91010.1 hypothetical protein ABI_24230 [Asticcacaulis biprosthecium C19]
MPDTASPSLDHYKRNAARLLKQARAGDAAALQRFQHLDNPPKDLHLKHALAVIAAEAGHDGWTALKHSTTGLDFSEFFGGHGLRDSLNPWFTNYDEAKAFQMDNGGVLLPYRHHFFVSSTAMLARLGFEEDHADWQAIGFDFVRPASAESQTRIKAGLHRRFFPA